MLNRANFDAKSLTFLKNLCTPVYFRKDDKNRWNRGLKSISSHNLVYHTNLSTGKAHANRLLITYDYHLSKYLC